MPPQRLWAPWRIDYLQGLDPAANDHAAPTRSTRAALDRPSSGCFLCDLASDDLTLDRWPQALLLLRDDRGTLMLNRYPYTNGHLLVAPRAHVADLCDFDVAQRTGLMELTHLACRLLREALNPQGANVGMNLGRAAGAGVPGHAHMHVVPRWHGDTNFATVLGDVRVVPQSLDDSYALMADALKRLDETRSRA